MELRIKVEKREETRRRENKRNCVFPLCVFMNNYLVSVCLGRGFIGNWDPGIGTHLF